jgi:hypothetical protein
MNSIEAFILRQEQLEQAKNSAAGATGDAAGDATGDASAAGDSTFASAHTSAQSLRDDRNIDQKRADALSAICATVLSDLSETVSSHRRPLTINVTIDLPTLLGLAENPGQLSGYGPIPAAVARHLASDATWRRFVTDPHTGTLLDYGRERYEPPQALKDFLIARDRTCRFPGCRRSALLSDLDHAQSWESGGATSLENIGALCRRHHRLKTHDGWKIESFPDGSCTWTSPLGKQYFTPARSLHEPV